MPKKKQPIVAIAYDFDGTLAPGNMQEHSFIPDIGMKKDDFWEEVGELAEKQDMDEILAYMYLMLKKADGKNKPINKQAFQEHGKNVPLFDGVSSWFDRINEYAKTQKVTLEHYIISSGLRELLEGTPIYKQFKYVFASGFLYDQHDVARWPALAINYTTKTQYLFRINKGIENSYNNKTINEYTLEQERRVPFSNIIYIGDGATDVPCMKMLKYQGGTAIAVYNPKIRGGKKNCQDLLKQGRVDYVVLADYQADKDMEVLVQGIIETISIKNKLGKYKTKPQSK